MQNMNQNDIKESTKLLLKNVTRFVRNTLMWKKCKIDTKLSTEYWTKKIKKIKTLKLKLYLANIWRSGH